MWRRPNRAPRVNSQRANSQAAKLSRVKVATTSTPLTRSMRLGSWWLDVLAVDRLQPLRPDHRPVLPPRVAPRVVEVRRARRERELGRELLVEVDAQARLLPR